MARKGNRSGPLEVRLELLLLDDEALENTVHPVQGIVEKKRPIRKNHALHGRMADIALMPEGDVLQSRLRVTPEKPRAAREVFRGDGVSLVRHGARALL